MVLRNVTVLRHLSNFRVVGHGIWQYCDICQISVAVYGLWQYWDTCEISEWPYVEFDSSETPVKFQSGWTTLNLYLPAPRSGVQLSPHLLGKVQLITSDSVEFIFARHSQVATFVDLPQRSRRSVTKNIWQGCITSWQWVEDIAAPVNFQYIHTCMQFNIICVYSVWIIIQKDDRNNFNLSGLNFIIHRGPVTHICITQLDHRCFR